MRSVVTAVSRAASVARRHADAFSTSHREVPAQGRPGRSLDHAGSGQRARVPAAALHSISQRRRRRSGDAVERRLRRRRLHARGVGREEVRLRVPRREGRASSHCEHDGPSLRARRQERHQERLRQAAHASGERRHGRVADEPRGRREDVPHQPLRHSRRVHARRGQSGAPAAEQLRTEGIQGRAVRQDRAESFRRLVSRARAAGIRVHFERVFLARHRPDGRRARARMFDPSRTALGLHAVRESRGRSDRRLDVPRSSRVPRASSSPRTSPPNTTFSPTSARKSATCSRRPRAVRTG